MPGKQRKRTPQEEGREFEKEFAKRLGANLVPGSGNQWWMKLDVKGKSFLWSCKYTSKETFAISRGILHEAVRAVIGPGGVGGDVYPGLAVRIVDEDYIIMRANDFYDLVSSGVEIVAPSRREGKMKRGNIPYFKRNMLE